MSEDDTGDDWFESAVSGDDEPDDDKESTEQEADTPWGETEEEESPWDESDGGSSGADDDAPFGESEGGPAFDESAEGGGFGDAAGEGAFGDEDGGAFGDSEDSGGAFGDSEDSGGAFGDSEDSGGAFGDSEDSGGDGDGLFDDEGFASAFEGGGDSEFDEEDFESDIPRIDLGIEGLDNMIQGGVPERHLMVSIGSAGTGKTTFGLQFLRHGLQNGESAVFITLEQSHESIIATAAERGWEFGRYEDEGMLAVVDLDPVEMANSLDNIQAELPQLIKDFGADRLVLDSVSLLEMMYDDQAKRRTEVFDFTRALKKAGVTTFLTSEASESNPYASRHGIIEYLTDAVFVLQYVRGETQETRLAVEIQKIRNANHSREKKPYEMTDQGISVYQQANIF
jgi:circadian clock protein KaiC